MMKYLLMIIGGVMLVISLPLYFYHKKAPLESVHDFVTCSEAEYPVMESFPRQCRTPEGTVYIEKVEIPVRPASTTEATSTLIQASSTITTSIISQ